MQRSGSGNQPPRGLVSWSTVVDMRSTDIRTSVSWRGARQSRPQAGLMTTYTPAIVSRETERAPHSCLQSPTAYRATCACNTTQIQDRLTCTAMSHGENHPAFLPLPYLTPAAQAISHHSLDTMSVAQHLVALILQTNFSSPIDQAWRI